MQLHVSYMYVDVFVDSKVDLGPTQIMLHTIHIGGFPLVRQHPQHISAIYRVEAQKLIQDMLQNNAVQPLVNLQASLGILTFKKNGVERSEQEGCLSAAESECFTRHPQRRKVVPNPRPFIEYSSNIY